MAYPTFPHPSSRLTSAIPPASPPAEWRCLECAKLLGIRRGAQLHIRMHGHDYVVSLPAEAICRGCGAHNRT